MISLFATVSEVGNICFLPLNIFFAFHSTWVTELTPLLLLLNFNRIDFPAQRIGTTFQWKKVQHEGS